MKFRILVEPWAVYVKDAVFFESQGGLTEPWGKNWLEVEATSIEAARAIGYGHGKGDLCRCGHVRAHHGNPIFPCMADDCECRGFKF